MPFFQRSKKSLTEILEARPQKTLADVRKHVLVATHIMLDDLAKLERSFYGFRKTSQNEIRRWVKPIQRVMDTLQYKELRADSHVEDVLRLASDPRYKFLVDVQSVSKLREVVGKVKDYIPEKFETIIANGNTVLKYLQEYCLSFHDNASEVLLETARDYENMIKQWISIISKNLDNVAKMADNFKAGNLNYLSMGVNTQDIAAKLECTAMPFLLIFPEACENIRLATKMIITWLETDGNYSGFLKNDVTEFGRRKENELLLLRDVQLRAHQARYKVLAAEHECEETEKELDNLKKKEEILLIDEEYVMNEYNEMKLEIDIKQFRKDELERNESKLNVQTFTETKELLTVQLRKLNEDFPALRKQHETIQAKLAFVNERRYELNKRNQTLVECKRTCAKLESTRETAENKYEELNRKIKLAKHLYLLKTSPDALERIFHKLDPADCRHTKSKSDLLDRVCSVVCREINNDWLRLYRNLPFHPRRGEATIQQDVETISRAVVRQNTEHQSLVAFQRWRRFHTRPKIDDIRSALRSIHRFDVLYEVEETINPTVKHAEMVDEQYPEFMDTKLIPYYKEVQRFDHLVATNKISLDRNYDLDWII